MAEFDLAKLMKDVSGADTGKQRIQYIPLDLIDPSPENFYSLEGLDELAGSIEMLGLQQPLLVRPTKGGRYTVISGHRRRASIMLICDGGSTQFADGVPCIVDTSAASEALQELKLIMANADTRKLTSADQSKQAERIEDLLRQLEDEGFEFPGRLRDWVAKITGMSRSKLGRLKVIREKLIPQFREKWEQGDINETCAYELAQSPEWIQKRIFSASPAAGLAQGVEAIRKNMLDGIEYADNQLSGPGCNRCTHGNAFLRHDLENPYNQCHGKTCCLECREAASSYSPCARMCSKAKAVRAKENAAIKEKREEAEKKRNDLLRSETQKSAARLIKAADAAGVSDDAEIKLSGYGSKTVKWIRLAANGEDIGFIYRNELSPANLDVAAAAKTLGCSADYICGLTEELAAQSEGADEDPENVPRMGTLPAAEWQTGDPPADGRYLCLVDMNTTKLHEQKCDRKDGAWFCYGSPIADMFTVEAWWPLPPEGDLWAAARRRGA